MRKGWRILPAIMPMNDPIHPPTVLSGWRVGSKTEVLRVLAREAAPRTGLGERVIFDALRQREGLGTTGVGAGIAVPHARLPGLARLCEAFFRFDRPIDFEAIDEQPVDLIFLVLAPEGAGTDHLRALSRVSRLLSDGAVCRELRSTTDPAVLHSILTGQFGPIAAQPAFRFQTAVLQDR